MKGLSSRRSSCRLSSCRLSPYRRSTSSRPRLRRPTGSSPLLPRRPRHSHHHRQPAQQGRMRGRASAPTHKIFSGESSLTPNIDRMLAPLLTSRNTSLSHSSKTSTKARKSTAHRGTSHFCEPYELTRGHLPLASICIRQSALSLACSWRLRPPPITGASSPLPSRLGPASSRGGRERMACPSVHRWRRRARGRRPKF